jgi:hypothetical protein
LIPIILKGSVTPEQQEKQRTPLAEPPTTKAQTVKWKHIHPASSSSSTSSSGEEGPSGRYGHSVVATPDGQSLLVFGGSNRVEFSSELFCFHVPDKTWRLITQGPEEDEAGGGGSSPHDKAPPPPSSSGTPCNSSSPSPPASHPSRRHFHCAGVVEGRMLVFGGKSNGYHNDLWAFHIGMPLTSSALQQRKKLNGGNMQRRKRGAK